MDDDTQSTKVYVNNEDNKSSSPNRNGEQIKETLIKRKSKKHAIVEDPISLDRTSSNNSELSDFPGSFPGKRRCSIKTRN